jgi:serine/threonine-protein kinase
MAETDRLLDLLVEWEDRRRRGQAVASEELCPDDPALRAALRERIQQRERFRPLWTASGQTQVATAPPTALAPPQLEGLEILGMLGRGGMGVVYQARQTQLDRLVAVKMILDGAHAGAGERARFRREAEAVARLQHPGIVEIYQVGEHDGLPYLVLEYVGGGSLAQQLDGTPLPANRAAALVLALAEAVQHAHARGILHRDLKPANVLLNPDGTPKITDFGLAKRLQGDRGETQAGAVLGTPSYMAPEQAEGQVGDLGPATDVYALGAILYELLTGRPPFKAASVLETLEQVRTLEPVRPTALQASVPRDLETICLKCLEKLPRHRYASAEALTTDLQCFLKGEPISARGLTLPERLARALSYSGSPAPLRAQSSILLRAGSVPVLVQLGLLMLFHDRPDYPVICLVLTALALSVLVPLVLWRTRDVVQRAPRPFRRFLWSVMFTRSAGGLLVPILVALMRPGHDLAEFYLVFPLWMFLEGNWCFLLGSEVGGGYLLALLHYAAALLVTLAPPLSPLALGAVVSTSLLLGGLYLRRLSE